MRRFRLSLLVLAPLVGACGQSLKLAKDDSRVVLAHQALAAPNPASVGSFAVRTLTYGSGTDKQRHAFRDSVTIKTKSVDGSAFASPPPKTAKKREDFFGFDTKKMPVNGTVWYPDGAGPFPLVLIVHGNHTMDDFSDPGYTYLGELLASRGFILVSVDENFLNGDMRNENDARGWMLLQHLKAWRTFNDSVGPFQHKVDMGNIALMGHSRGGEAVAVAAALNRLKHYPDDANQTFDFGFAIKSLVAIAPVDGQYKPADTPTPLENVNYLVIHGSHDGDVSSFSGNRQWERVKFTDGGEWFKSAIYVYRANHGQWNTVWNNKDNGPRSDRFLDLRGLITPEEQRQFGKVIISAFLESTLKGKREYLPIFRDHRVIGDWLPKTMYITRFQDSRFRALADYQEDVDVESGSVRGVTIAGDSLATWKEAVVPMRWKNNDFGTNAVWIGWNNRIAGPDTTKVGRPASYAITIPDSLRTAWRVDERASLEFSLAPTNVKPGPRSPAKDSTKKGADSAKTKGRPPKKPDAKKAEPDTTPVDITIALVDASGVVARVPLSRYGAVRRPLETHVYRRASREESQFANQFEYVLQTYAIPVADFVKEQPSFDAKKIVSVRWIFDRLAAGTIILDDVGISSLDPAFLAVRADH
ncbi:MAG: MFS transporter [Gemmatimonadaceae bacterium]